MGKVNGASVFLPAELKLGAKDEEKKANLELRANTKAEAEKLLAAVKANGMESIQSQLPKGAEYKAYEEVSNKTFKNNDNIIAEFAIMLQKRKK